MTEVFGSVEPSEKMQRLLWNQVVVKYIQVYFKGKSTEDVSGNKSPESNDIIRTLVSFVDSYGEDPIFQCIGQCNTNINIDLLKESVKQAKEQMKAAEKPQRDENEESEDEEDGDDEDEEEEESEEEEE